MGHPYDELECKEGIVYEYDNTLGMCQLCYGRYMKTEFISSKEYSEGDHCPEEGSKRMITASSEEHIDVVIKGNKSDYIGIEAYIPSDDEC